MGPRNMTKGSDMARQLTFIDCDENRLELWLKPDRVQLVVIDSRPELAAGELRRFASAVFGEYVAPGLADRLDAARRQLDEVRERAGAEAQPALAAALAAVDDVAAAIAGAGASGEPELGQVISATSVLRYPPLRPLRGVRARESGTLTWGGVEVAR